MTEEKKVKMNRLYCIRSPNLPNKIFISYTRNKSLDRRLIQHENNYAKFQGEHKGEQKGQQERKNVCVPMKDLSGLIIGKGKYYIELLVEYTPDINLDQLKANWRNYIRKLKKDNENLPVQSRMECVNDDFT